MIVACKIANILEVSNKHMCGIFAYLGKKNNAGDIVLNGLKSLEYRGYDSWGVAVKEKNNDRLFVEKHVGKIGEAQLPKIVSNSAIGHTRWATHGGVTELNAHPHLDCQKRVVVVHNGIVENYEEIKNRLIKKGHVFKSETDTEVIAHLAEDKLLPVLKNNSILIKEMLLLFNSLKGLNAIIIFIPELNFFLSIKNGSPLVLGLNRKNKEFVLASDYSGILPYTQTVYFLGDDELLFVNKNGSKLFDKSGSERKIEFINVEYKKESLNLGKYKHYMIKEINEQPTILRNIVNTQKENITNLSQVIKKSYGAYLIGCGTAYYACLAGTYLFSKIAKRHTNANIGSEFSYSEDFLTEKSLVIALSQSGETIDIISSIKKAKDKKAKICAITNVLGSTLYRMSDYRMLLGAGPEKCVLATKSFTSKISILNLLAHAINSDYPNGVIEINKAIAEVERIIRLKNIMNLAKDLRNKEHIYILGRGLSYPTALESALKIKEVSYIHAEGFAGGELKHGVIALIGKGTPVIVYNPEDETYQDTLSSAHEVKARGAYLIGVSSKNNPVFDELIKVENCQNATIIPNVVVAQLLGYYLALEKGLDPDKPRNLAKSVTVK